MTNKWLSRRQLAVIEDMFAGELDEPAILEKHRVSQKAFSRWQGEELFRAELGRRLAWLNFQSELIIARYKSLAAAKLVQLTESEKEETARKACLDIISVPKSSAQRASQSLDESQATSPQQYQQLSPETASRLLAVLAEKNGENR